MQYQIVLAVSVLSLYAVKVIQINSYICITYLVLNADDCDCLFLHWPSIDHKIILGSVLETFITIGVSSA